MVSIGNMQFDNEEFYKQIEEEYDVALRRNLKKSWEDYWAWSVPAITTKRIVNLILMLHTQ